MLLNEVVLMVVFITVVIVYLWFFKIIKILVCLSFGISHHVMIGTLISMQLDHIVSAIIAIVMVVAALK